jgi:hypothetical protein
MAALRARRFVCPAIWFKGADYRRKMNCSMYQFISIIKESDYYRDCCTKA